MADKYIKSLSENTSPSSTDAVEIDDGVNSEYVTLANLVKGAVAPGTAGNFLLSNGTDWISTKQTGSNYIIVPSVASNDLTVAIKGIDGNDASATSPIVVRIGNTVRLITGALSVTKADGTNWFNSGSAALATNEVDYFVYLGYNATDGVVIGFARIPYATLYSEFSATSTNEKYCAISTITNAAAGDNYVNIGRFSAILSAGAGYTWTVPTFTTTNLIHRPIFETRKLLWTTTATSQGGTPTTVTTSNSYKLAGDLLSIFTTITITDKGTATGALYINAPFAAAALSALYGYESAITGNSLTAKYSTSTITLFKYDASTVWTSGWVPVVSGNVLI